MAIVVSFDQSIMRGPAIELGPFSSVELVHRRISADGYSIAVRKTSGIWAIGDGFIDAHIRPEARDDGLSLLFSDPWRNGEVRLRAPGVRLAGDRLWIEESGAWIATDQDDERSWVLEASGDAYDRLLAA